MVELKRTAQRLIKQILTPVMSVCYRDRLRKAKRLNRRVLFVANNELMFQHVNAVWAAYQYKAEYAVHLCSTETISFRWTKYQTLRRMKALARSKGINFWPDYIAGKIEWDLLISAEPDLPCHLFSNKTKKILIQHALVGIKEVDGCLYPYHPKNDFSTEGECRFDAIFETSSYAYNQVILQEPRYEGVVKLVGSMPADALTDLNNQRDKIRQDMGYAKDDYVVLLQSTFRESLMEDLGVALLHQCRKISEEHGWKFIVSLHPNHWRGEYSEKNPWGRTAQEFESGLIHIRPPDEDANRSLIAADIAVTDHTSLCYNYALLGKAALFYLPPEGNQVMDVLGGLVGCCASFDAPANLYEKLLEAERVFDKQGVERLLADMFPYLGKARERNNEVFDELLNKV